MLLGAAYASSQQAASFQVDRAAYEAVCTSDKGSECRYHFLLIATYTNQGTDPAYLDRCMPGRRSPMYGVEPFPDTSDDAAWDLVWGCVGGLSPIVVAPHEVRVDTLLMAGPNQFDGKTHAPTGRLEGEFRLIYDVRLCHQGSATCSAQHLVKSQAFRVRRAS